MVVMTTKTRSEAPGRDPVLGETNRGRCGGTCGWGQARSPCDCRGQGRGAGRGRRTLALTWGLPARPRCPRGAPPLILEATRVHTAPSHKGLLGNTTPTDGQRDPILVRAALAPVIGVDSLGAGFSCSSKGSRFRWSD